MSWIFVALVTKECHFCTLLLNNWNIIVNSLLLTHPYLKFPVSTSETLNYKQAPIYIKNNTINNIYPNSLTNYLKKNVVDQWYPMILLVKEEEWISNNITNPIIMNSSQVNNKVILSISYDTRVIDQFKKWVDDVLHITVNNNIIVDNLVCKNVLNLISIY